VSEGYSHPGSRREQRLRDHLIVCWGTLGDRSVLYRLRALAGPDTEIVCICPDADAKRKSRTPGAPDPRVWFITAEIDDRTALEESCVAQARSVLVQVSTAGVKQGMEDERASMPPCDTLALRAVIALRSISFGVPILVEPLEHSSIDYLRVAGAQHIVSEEVIGARLLAQAALGHGTGAVWESLLSCASGVHRIESVEVNERWIDSAPWDDGAASSVEEAIPIGLFMDNQLIVNPDPSCTPRHPGRMFVLSAKDSDRVAR